MALRLYIVAILAIKTLAASSGAQAQDDAIVKPYILNVFVDGGWDPTMVFEGKIGVATIAQETGSTLRQSSSGIFHVANASRPAVDVFFDTYGSRCAIVNGLSTGSLEDRESYLRSFTSVPAEAAAPIDWMTWYASQVGSTQSYPMLSIDTPHLTAQCINACRYLDSTRLDSYINAIPNASDFPAALKDHATAFLSQAYSNRATNVSPGGNDFLKVYSINNQFQKDQTFRSNLTNVVSSITVGPDDSSFLRNSKIALEFFRSGYSQVANIRYGTARQWDTQSDHFSQANALFESFFGDLKEVLNFAETNGVLPNLLVTVTSNLGRAPNLNAQNGKDRWQFTSALLCGNGIKGGTTVGYTDNYLRGVPINPLFGTTDGTNDVTLEFKNVIAALFLKYGLTYEVYVAQLPLSPILGP